tara:strand:- start:2208 stop:2657 length:450 start_codon:yes stop_codon:yes gene_type:complete
MAIKDTLAHPPYLGFQLDWPLFIKIPFDAVGKTWEKNDYFNWQGYQLNPERIATLYNAGFVHHNTELEIQSKVGDRLSEMNSEQLLSLVQLLNQEVKDRTSSSKEFNEKRCKQSKFDDKQRGLIRSWLRHNNWAQEDFYRIRDYVLGEN